MGLLDSSYSTVNGQSPRKSDRQIPGQEMNVRGLLDAATNIPVVGDALSGGMAIYDAAKGDYPSAAMNALGVLPFVSGTFIGKGAKTWDAIKAAEAEKRIAAGEDVRKVWKETGTFKGPDGHLRQEIPDDASSLRVENIPSRKGVLSVANEYLYSQGVKPTLDIGSPDSLVSPMLKQEALQYAKNKVERLPPPTAPVSQVLNHGKLWMNYPEMMTYPVTKQLGSAKGSFDPESNLVSLGGGDIAQTANGMHSTSIHELQHAIQQREGWARGGSVDSIARQSKENEAAISYHNENLRNLVRQMDALSKTGDKQALQKLSENYQAIMGRKLDLVKQTNIDPYDAYRRLAGEAEARATQSRMNMNMEQRLNTYPLDSYDVPVDQLIIRGSLLK